MLHRVKGKLEVECDDCGEIFDQEDENTFGELISSMKDFGWSIKKVGDVWTHTCPGCKE